MAELNSVEKVVNILADILVSSKRFRSLCDAGLRYRGRSVLFEHLINALAVFSKSMREYSALPLENATAWMLKGCRTAIALQICELTSPEKDSMNLILSSLEKDTKLIDQSRLIRFVDEKFASGELFFGETVIYNDDNESSLVTDQGDDELPPEMEMFSDTSAIKSMLCFGPAFEDGCKQLTAGLFPSPIEQIRKTLSKYVPDDGQNRSIACLVEWKLLAYAQSEAATAKDLDAIFTITGELDSSYVSRFSDYLSEGWGSQNSMLPFLKTLLNKINVKGSRGEDGSITVTYDGLEIRMFPATASVKEQAYIKLTGQHDSFRIWLEQIAWIAATLRSHLDGQLTISHVDFSIQHAMYPDPTTGRYAPTFFQLSLVGQDQIFEPDSDAVGHCWTSIFPESVLAHGFPIPKNNRPENARGLEVPFDIMAAFSGVRYPLSVKDRIVFASNNSVLIPITKIDSDSIQWHFVRSIDWLKQVIPTVSERWDARLETHNLSSLTHSRTFLGFWNRSEVLLGTAEFEHVDASESGVPRVSQVTFQASQQSFSIDVTDQGYGTSTDGRRWKFSRGETAFIRASNSITDPMLLRAAIQPVLLYDQESCAAFLVSELSFILQLVTMYLRTESLLKRQRIPLAKVSIDNEHAILETIRGARDLTVSFSSGSSRRYIDVVRAIADLVEQRRYQTRARKLYGVTPSSSGLRGWDHADIQARKFEIWERELRPNTLEKRPIWWDLFRDSETLVFFTCLAKAPMRNSNVEPRDGTFNCHAWDTIPKGKHVLLANMKQLEQLRAETCQNPRNHPTRYMLNDHITWARPHKARLFDQNCRTGGSCNPVQLLVRTNIATSQPSDLPEGWIDDTKYQRHPGRLEDTGAVLFTNHSDDIAPRRCVRRSPKRLSTKEWNYPFIGVSLVVAILAYWNFRFFVVCFVLVGLAYSLK